MADNKLRNMNADDAVELLLKLRSILDVRKFFGYNKNLVNKLKESFDVIQSVYDKYRPIAGDVNTVQTLGSRTMQNILDIHGISILNTLLEINAISTRFTDKYFNKAMTFQNSEDLKYAEMVNNTDQNFVLFINSKGENGTDELSRIKTLLSNFTSGSIRIRPVSYTIDGSEENITEAFDYHLLVYLVMCMETENSIFIDKRKRVSENKAAFIAAGNDEKMFHTSYFGDISSCRSSCVGLCAASCDETCYGCGGTCAGQCTSSCGDCSKSCTFTCASNCTNGCSGCSGCSNGCDGCSITCTSNCGGNCSNFCGNCDGSCYGSTTGATTTCGCGSECATSCKAGCSATSTSPTPVTTDPEPPIVIEPDPIPQPDSLFDSQYVPSNYGDPGNHPSGGWVPNSDGSGGHWTYNDGNGNTYNTGEMSNINNGGDGSGNTYTTPWGSTSTHKYI